MNNYLGEPRFEGRRVEIQAVDNGWIVVVHNVVDREPGEVEKLYKALAGVLPHINYGAMQGAVQGIDEAIDPYKENDVEREAKKQKKLEMIGKAIEKAFEKPERMTKPIETYVFLDHGKMIAFLSEFLSPPKEEPEPEAMKCDEFLSYFKDGITEMPEPKTARRIFAHFRACPECAKFASDKIGGLLG